MIRLLAVLCASFSILFQPAHSMISSLDPQLLCKHTLTMIANDFPNYKCVDDYEEAKSGAFGAVFTFVSKLHPKDYMSVKFVLLDSWLKVNDFKHECLVHSFVSGHKNIIWQRGCGRGKIYGYEYGYIAMDTATGGTLEELITSSPLHFRDPDFVINMFRRILEGAHHIHEANYIHRDLKPGNIVLDYRKIPYIIDFGLAAKIGAPGSTFTSRILIDPYQLMDPKAYLSANTDVHALGVTLYMMVHQMSPPFFGSKWGTIEDSIKKGIYRINPDTHWLIAYLIVKCLTYSKTYRKTIPEMLELIQKYWIKISPNKRSYAKFGDSVLSKSSDFLKGKKFLNSFFIYPFDDFMPPKNDLIIPKPEFDFPILSDNDALVNFGKEFLNDIQKIPPKKDELSGKLLNNQIKNNEIEDGVERFRSYLKFLEKERKKLLKIAKEDIKDVQKKHLNKLKPTFLPKIHQKLARSNRILTEEAQVPGLPSPFFSALSYPIGLLGILLLTGVAVGAALRLALRRSSSIIFSCAQKPLAPVAEFIGTEPTVTLATGDSVQPNQIAH